MRVACLFSGGKDSCFALFWALYQGFEPILVTMKSAEYSLMFHHPNIEKTKLQAEAVGVKQVIVETDDKNELKDLEKTLKELEVEGIVTGALASEYQKQRIDNIGEELGVPTYSPIWHKRDQLLPEILEYFEIYISAVSAEGMGEDLLGKPFSELTKRKIKGIHPMLEGGEGETFVADAPFFKHAIKIKGWKTTWDGVRGVAEIK